MSPADARALFYARAPWSRNRRNQQNQSDPNRMFPIIDRLLRSRLIRIDRSQGSDLNSEPCSDINDGDMVLISNYCSLSHDVGIAQDRDPFHRAEAYFPA